MAGRWRDPVECNLNNNLKAPQLAGFYNTSQPQASAGLDLASLSLCNHLGLHPLRGGPDLSQALSDCRPLPAEEPGPDLGLLPPLDDRADQGGAWPSVPRVSPETSCWGDSPLRLRPHQRTIEAKDLFLRLCDENLYKENEQRDYGRY